MSRTSPPGCNRTRRTLHSEEHVMSRSYRSLLPRRAAVVPVLAAALALAPESAGAQGFLKRVKEAAKDAAAEAATRKAEGAARTGAETATDKTIDAATGRALCAVGQGKCAAGADTAATAAVASRGAAAAPKPGEGAWANYDFVPGERVLFADDFTQETVGNFPRRLEFKDGSSEVVEWQGKRWLSSGDAGVFIIPLPEVLPERFTMEFDLAGNGNAMEVIFDGKSDRYSKRAGVDFVQFGTWFAGVAGNDRSANTSTGYKTDTEPVKARIMADGDYVKVFVNEKRVANVPNAKLGRSNKIYVMLNGWDGKAPRMIADVRVAAGGRKLYEALSTAGRVATQGIYFDTGSDRIRPESSPTLKEIGQMLAEHAELKLAIEGHTDGSGDAAANQALSGKRAEAVKAALVAGYGVNAARLTAKGVGAAKPAASNATAEGRQANRRVELVRL
jgi:outer membrane protein OmpA-like peptidoglycan-associated protein